MGIWNFASPFLVGHFKIKKLVAEAVELWESRRVYGICGQGVENSFSVFHALPTGGVSAFPHFHSFLYQV